MPPKRFAPNDPREWLNRARSNVIQAKEKRPRVYLEDLCFNAQQAAEKAVKAVLLHRGVRSPYIHDLSELLKLLKEAGEEVPAEVLDARELSNYAVQTRYPGPAEPVTQKEYREAVAMAERVVRWAEKIISGKRR